jgi:thiosulfate/3-mercaptopyruvate sulfurtransferase
MFRSKIALPTLVLVFGACRPAETPAPAVEAPAVEFANSELLVSTDWLSENLDGENVRIVDARKREGYEAGHVPGAVNIPHSATFDPDREPPGLVGPPEAIARLFGDAGIDEYAHVVVYDEGRATEAARVFWTLEYYGHPNVSVLDGGLKKWTAEGRTLSTEPPEVTPATFTVRARPEALSTRELILDELEEDGAVMLDARTEEEFRGEDVRAERGGHIPGAVHIEWTENFTSGEAPVFKSALELEKLYEDQGVTKDKRVHAY